MQYLEYNDPLLITWRDSYIDKSDTQKIVNNRIVLSEIPDPFTHVTISGYTEIYNGNPTSNQFIVNYQNGIITFNSTEEGKTVTATYKGRGIIQYPAERIYVHSTNPDITQNIQQMIDDGQQAIQVYTDIGNAINTANTVKGQLETDINTGNTLHTNLTNDISSGNSLHTTLTNDINSGNTLKSNLESNISSGNSLHTTLTNDINSGNTLHTTLTNDINTGNTLNTTLTSDINTGNTLHTTLTNDINSGNTLKTNLETDIDAGNSLHTTLTTDINTGNTLKSDLETDISTGNSLHNTLTSDINTGNTLHTNLTDDISTGNTLKSNLDISITNATDINNTLNGSIASGTNKIQEMDAKITEANTAINNINTTNTNFSVWENYDNTKTYVPMNKVTYQGSSYVCIQQSTGNLPTNTAYWQLIAQKGQDVVDWNNIINKPSSYTPSAHKSTHATGGADALTPADIGAVNKAGDTMTGELSLPSIVISDTLGNKWRFKIDGTNNIAYFEEVL